MSKNRTLMAGLLLSLTSITTEASLTVGYADGKSVVYSSLGNITWTGDANLLGTLQNKLGYEVVVNSIIAVSPVIIDMPNIFDTPANSGKHTVSSLDFDSNRLGAVSWFGAKAFINYLNSTAYAGSSQWGLPITPPSNDQTGNFEQTSSQLGELFYKELGGTAGNPIPKTSYFSNEQDWVYWSDTQDPYANDLAYNFITSNGVFSKYYKDFPLYAWAVSPGNLTSVPLPGAAWLFSAWIGLMALSMRYKPKASIIIH
ncbi:MAG: hypothetical protein BVN35_21890 [Proteobacteria bacterium ST_bin11]|nr:MAG: hypothetical protein BVN35_21890 [Proteobacteria bacterium ST_bin11]